MERFTIFIYLFFVHHKRLFYGIVLSTLVLFGYLSSKITFEEDITKLLPSVEGGNGDSKLVFNNLKVKDRIFILFHAAKPDTEPDSLVTVCDSFMDDLVRNDSANKLIHNVLYKIDEDLLQSSIEFLYDNIPTFIKTTQYAQIDSMLTDKCVERQMTENYNLLTSVAGADLQSIILRDPIALRKLMLSHINLGQGLGSNYSFYDHHLVTADTSLMVAFLAPNFEAFESGKNNKLVKSIEQLVARYAQLHPDVEIMFHGQPVNGVYNSRRVKKDLLETVSISLVIICILLLLCFKNKSTLIYLLSPVIYGVLFAMAVFYVTKGSISLMAVAIGAVVMGVAFSYCLHIITHHKYVNNPKLLLKDQTQPVIMGALTTIGAFMSLLLTKSELLHDFGLFASLGMVGTTVFCLLFLPQLLNVKSNRKSVRAFALIERINSFPLEKQKWLIALIVLVSVGGFLFADLNKLFDANLQNISYYDARAKQSERLLATKTVASDSLSTVYFAAVHENLDSALIIGQKMCVRLDTAVARGLISGYTSTFSLFIPTGEQQQRIDAWNDYWTDNRKKTAEEEVSRAAVRHKFAPGSFASFDEMLNTDYEPVSLYDAGVLPEEILSTLIEYSDGRYMVFVPVRMDRNRMLKAAGDFVTVGEAGMVVVEPMYYSVAMLQKLRDDFNVILGVSSLFVLVLLLLSLRNIVLAVLAFLPMCLSWYIVLGTMAVFDMRFNVINIIVSSFIFGIGVDYSIFVMDGLLARYRTKEPLLTFHKTAIFFSAIILIIAVASLMFAKHPALSSIGVSTLIGMGATILMAYSLQPFLFAWLITNRVAKGKAPLSISKLKWLKAPNEVRAINEAYLYTGKAARQLRHVLKKTNRYALLTESVRGEHSLLDYGCGYGFNAYWAAQVNSGIQITGFETNRNMLALADNNYRKTPLMRFTNERVVLESAYDVIVVNKRIIYGAEIMERWLKHAHAALLERAVAEEYGRLCRDAGFVYVGEDGMFVCWRKNV